MVLLSNKVDLFYVQTLSGQVSYKGEWLIQELFKNPELCHLRDTYLKAITFLGRKMLLQIVFAVI